MSGPVCLVVLPRFPNSFTGVGQRSQLLLDAAIATGPTHVVLLHPGGPIETLRARDDILSVRVLLSRRLTPPRSRLVELKEKIKLPGMANLFLPQWAYRVDRNLQRNLLAAIEEVGADVVLFRYSKFFCISGLQRTAAYRVLVDVDDRDDQKYRSRLEQLFGQGLVESLPLSWVLDRLARMLRSRLSEATLVWFAAEEDRWELDPAKTAVFANVPFATPVKPVPIDHDSHVVLFVGTFVHPPNQDAVRWFLRTCWPDIRERCPKAQFRIVGFGDWKTLEGDFSHLSGVSYVGTVDDVAAEYARARLVVCPVQEGGGSKIKLVEAAGFARPVVATPHSLRGFSDRLADAVTIVETPDDFALACLTFLEDSQEAEKVGHDLHAIQMAQYSRPASIEKISRDIRSCVGSD